MGYENATGDSDSASLGSNPSPPATLSSEKSAPSPIGQGGQGGTDRECSPHENRHSRFKPIIFSAPMVRAILALMLTATWAGPAAAECCRYKAMVLKCWDADTCTVQIALGLGIAATERIRLARIDAWEVRGPERPKGLIARDFVRDWIVGREVVIVTDDDDRGKYGRLIADVLVDGESVSDRLVADGHAEYVEY